MKRITNNYILGLILIVALILRMYNYWNIPFTHDEFSALFRLDFDSFSDVVKYGVKHGDTHPAGIQVFLYYWTKLVGFSEPAFKFPFLLFGIGSVFLTYKIGKLWFNETVGLLAASITVVSEYTVMYSQIGRPYISGLFFSLAMVYYLTKLIQTPEKGFWKNGLLFMLMGALCAYNHHFSLLFAALVGISGSLLIPRKYLLKYFLLGVGIFVLYIPHLDIFFHQFGHGGIEGWLGKPTPEFFYKYIFYIFNFSFLFLLATCGIIVYLIVKQKEIKFPKKPVLLFSTWFLLPLLVGYFYSVYVNAVLQYSVLIFSFTYLLFVLFGWVKEYSPKTNLILVSILLIGGIYSLVFTRQHYHYFYKLPQYEFLKEVNQLQQSEQNVLSFIAAESSIVDYYLTHRNLSSNFTNIYDFESLSELREFLQQESPKNDLLYFGCMSFAEPKVIPIIREFYPNIASQTNYWNGTSYVFSKNKKNTQILSLLDFEESQHENWSFLNELIIDSNVINNEYSYLVPSTLEWGPAFEIPFSEIDLKPPYYIDISVKIKSLSTHEGIALSTAVLDGTEMPPYFNNDYLKDQYVKTNEDWITLYASVKLIDIGFNPKKATFKTFIWNTAGEEFIVDDFQIEIRSENPVLYGNVEPF